LTYRPYIYIYIYLYIYIDDNNNMKTNIMFG
jgi:hypothetical protein